MTKIFNFSVFLTLFFASIVGSLPTGVDDSDSVPFPPYQEMDEIQELPSNYINVELVNQTGNFESTTETEVSSTSSTTEISQDPSSSSTPNFFEKLDATTPLTINKPDEIQDFLGQKSRFCPQVLCSPPPNPNYASCELSAEGTTYNILSPVLGDLSYCCPIWICIRKDGSMFTHYGVSQDSDIKDKKIKISAQTGTIGEKGHYAALKSSTPTFGFPKLFNFSPNYNFIQGQDQVDSDQKITTTTTTTTTTSPPPPTTTEVTSSPDILVKKVASQTIPEIPRKPSENIENLENFQKLPIIPITQNQNPPNQFYNLPIPVQYIFALPPVVNYDPIPRFREIAWPNPQKQQQQQQQFYDLYNLKSRTFLNNYPQQQQVYNNPYSIQQQQLYNPYVQQQGSPFQQQQPLYNVPLNSNYQPNVQNWNQQQFQEPQQEYFNYY